MGENRRVMMTEDLALAAIEAARAALVEQVGPAVVGDHVEAVPEQVPGPVHVVTHYFTATQRGYPGWWWAVTVAHVPGDEGVTVDEVVLLPGQDAIVAPEWLPYRDRIQPGDLSPGDLLPTEEDDARLVPGYLGGDPGDYLLGPDDDEAEEDRELFRSVVEELGLGRPRVLSLEGRELAAERWYEGSHGPESPLAASAPATCSSCGFLVRMAGPLSRVFGVCANAYANDDGRVVSWDHGCGAHSEAQLGTKSQPQPLSDPVLDTLSWDELEQF
jgi:hypothetical protein